MTFFGDDDNEMRSYLARDDRDIESVLRGHQPADRPDLEQLARLVDDLHHAAAVPAHPNATLAALLAAGLPPADPAVVSAPASHARRRAATLRWAHLRSLRTGAKAATVATVAVLTVATAAVAGALPAPIQDKVSTAVETVTPWHIPRPAGHGIGEDVREKARHHGQDKDKDNAGSTDAGTPTQTGKPALPGNSDHSAKPEHPRGGDDASQAPMPNPAQTRKPVDPGNSSHSATTGKPSKAGDSARTGDHASPPLPPGRPTEPSRKGAQKASGPAASHPPDAPPAPHPNPWAVPR